MKSIKDSVHELLSDLIRQHGMDSFYSIKEHEITGRNGTQFKFRGLKHNTTDLKSLEGADILWIEEAENVSDKSYEIVIPTIRKENSQIWISFNPKNATDATWRRFIVEGDDDVIARKVSWRDNPFFPAVLEKERAKLEARDPEAYAHVWEGDFDTRYSGAVYAKFINHDQIKPNVNHDPAFPVYTCWDLGYDDATAIWFYQIGAGEVFLIDYYETSGADVRQCVEACYGRAIIVDDIDKVTGEVTGWHFGDDLPDHAHRKNWQYHHDIVPHDAGYKIQAAQGRSIVGQMQRFGRKPFIVQSTTMQQSIEALRETLPKCWINSVRCADGVQALTHYRFEYDDDKQVFRREPVHDWSSHGCDALEGMARVWRDAASPVTQKRLEHDRLWDKFKSDRSKYGLSQEDPYRQKPIRKSKR